MSLSDKPTSNLAVLTHVKLSYSLGETEEHTQGFEILELGTRAGP